jgi:hypothetical protein
MEGCASAGWLRANGLPSHQSRAARRFLFFSTTWHHLGMSGRFSQHYSWSEVDAFLNAFGTPQNLRPYYNIVPPLG